MNPVIDFFEVLGLFAGGLVALMLVVPLLAVMTLLVAKVISNFLWSQQDWRTEREYHLQYGPLSPYRRSTMVQITVKTLTGRELLVALGSHIFRTGRRISQQAIMIGQSYLCRFWQKILWVWRADPVQLTWRYGLTLAVLLSCMWSSTFLLGGAPPTITRVGHAFSTEPVFSGFAISRLWDIPAAFLAVAAVVGSLWLFNRFVCGEVNPTKKNLAFLVKLFALFVAPLTVLGWPGLANSSSSFSSLLTTLLQVAIQLTSLAFWLILISGAIRQSHLYEPCHLWQNTNAHQLGVAVFSLLTITGVVIGLFFWGLPLGLMIGLGSGLVGGVLATCTAYIITIFLRLMAYPE
ncbi:hypothetical protein KKF05_04270 [Patescibacteria group bacterium]|nr:hypothetical protein [Patescibacteria group bacterium]